MIALKAWLAKWWGAVVAATIFVFGLIAALSAGARGNKNAAANARADATEKIAKKNIDALNAQLEVLKKDETRNAGAIATTQADLESKRNALNEKFVAHGLSAEEIADRFRGLRL